MSHRIEKAWMALEQVPDPEIPAISVVELGIVRSVSESEGLLKVSITPTYSGCPATQVIEKDVQDALERASLAPYTVENVLFPPWSTSMINNSGLEKLLKYGIAPPAEEITDKKALMGQPRQITCPQCGSRDTHMISQFGSTPCKAHFQCKACLEPFDYFKCL